MMVSYLFMNQRLSRNRKCNNQLYDFLGTALELGEEYIFLYQIENICVIYGKTTSKSQDVFLLAGIVSTK